MWLDRVVLMSPSLDKARSFSLRVEDLTIGELVAQRRVESLDIAVSRGDPS